MRSRRIVIALLLSLLTYLLPLPTQADEQANAWTRYPIPQKGEAGDWVLTGGGTGVTAITVAFDGTIYAATEEISGSPLNEYDLFRFSNGGYTWTPLWRIPDDDNPNGGDDPKIIALILPRWEYADILYL